MKVKLLQQNIHVTDTLQRTPLYSGHYFEVPMVSTVERFHCSFLYLDHSFKSSGKYPFSNKKLTVFVISERCISSATLSMSVGISPTGVASILKITCRTCYSVTYLERKRFIAHISFSNLINTLVKNKFFKDVFRSNGRATLIFLIFNA